VACAGGDSMIAGSYSSEERMKSVDRDFVRHGSGLTIWHLAYFFMAGGAIGMLVKIWEGIHLRGLPYHTAIPSIVLLLFFISPLIFSFQFRRYIRCALNENLVSKRVAENCEYWIGLLIFYVYLAFLLFVLRLVIV
jgi:hypothetical protein